MAFPPSGGRMERGHRPPPRESNGDVTGADRSSHLEGVGMCLPLNPLLLQFPLLGGGGHRFRVREISCRLAGRAAGPSHKGSMEALACYTGQLKSWQCFLKNTQSFDWFSEYIG